MERMENNKIARRVYVGKCAGSPPVDRLEKSWINTVKEYLKKKKRFGCQASKENGV